MTYLRRRDDERRQREKSPIEVKQWRKIEAHVRRKLGFKQDKHSRKLGIDGVCEKIAFLGPDGVEVEEDKYWEYGDPAGRIEMHSDLFVDKMVLDPFLNFMESIIGAKINDTNFEFLKSKQIRMPNDRNSKLVLTIRISDFKFVSGFVLRIFNRSKL